MKTNDTLKTYKARFWGAKERKATITKTEITVQATSASDAIERLRHQLGYAVINGLRIREIAPNH